MLGIIKSPDGGARKTYTFDGMRWTDGPTLNVFGYRIIRTQNTNRAVLVRSDELYTYMAWVGATNVGPIAISNRFPPTMCLYEEPDGGLYGEGYGLIWRANAGLIMPVNNISKADVCLGTNLVRSMPHEPRQSYILSKCDKYLDDQHSVLDVCKKRNGKNFHGAFYCDIATLQGGVVYMSDGMHSIYARDPRMEYTFPLYKQRQLSDYYDTMFAEGFLISIPYGQLPQMHITDMRSPYTTYSIGMPVDFDQHDNCAVFCP